MAIESCVAQSELAESVHEGGFTLRFGVLALDDFCGASRDDGVFGHVFNDDGAGGDDRIFADVNANHNMTDITFSSYVEALENLFVIKDIDAWTPQIRSKTAIRAAKKHVFVDQSIGLAALGIKPDYFYKDLDLFGHVFENMILRDLLAFAELQNAHVMHYSDDMGLEADAVYQLTDGRYALIEIKTGENAIPAAEKNLLKFGEIIRKHNAAALKDEEHPGVLYREPDLLLIICANASMAYTTEKGIKIIPAGCLRD